MNTRPRVVSSFSVGTSYRGLTCLGRSLTDGVEVTTRLSSMNTIRIRNSSIPKRYLLDGKGVELGTLTTNLVSVCGSSSRQLGFLLDTGRIRERFRKLGSIRFTSYISGFSDFVL